MAAVSVRNQLARQGVRFPVVFPVLTLTFITDNRRHDYDNLVASFKFGLDGLVDAGILADDSTRAIAELRVRHEVGERGVRVTVGESGELLT